MHSTTRLLLPIPDATDAESAFPAVSSTQMQTLDNAAMILQGTLANRPAFGTYGRWYLATDDTSSGSAIGTAWFDTGSAWSSGWNPPSRGAVNIPGSESRTNTAYGTMPTPDQVTGIVLPPNGKIIVDYQATWQESVSGAGRAAIFLGSNQLTIAGQATGSSVADTPNAQAAYTNSGTAAKNNELFSGPVGLLSAQNAGVSGYGGDSTTGQAVGARVGNWINDVSLGLAETGVVGAGGSCEIFAAAGTYTVSVQFKASSGSVTVSNRKLWVEVKSFG